MANYRLFYFGRDNHILRAEVIDCPADSDAIAIANAKSREYPAIEVWEGPRKVQRVDADIAANHDGS